MNSKDISALQKEYVLQSWSVQKDLAPIAIAKAEGIYMWDYEGNRYSDMSSQLVNLNVGHGNKEIIKAIQQQAETYCYISPSYASKPRAELAKMIIETLPDNMGKIFFTNGGADANENAIKMARMASGKHKIFSRYRSYHGSSFGAGNLTGEPRRYPLEPGIPGFVKFFDPYIYREPLAFESEEAATQYYLAKLEEQIKYEGENQIAAIVLETITGSNGILIPPVGYLPGVRKLCDKYEILLICDEVMAGFGRTGTMWAFENFDIKPDIVTFAKGITCGYVQLGGVAVSKKIASYFDHYQLSCGLTYSGHPLACAAGIACLNFYEDQNILDNVKKQGAVLKGELKGLQKKHQSIGDVRSIGLFSALELVVNRTTKEPLVPYGKDNNGIMKGIVQRLSKLGFMTYSHENMIFITPPLIIKEEQLVEELKKLDLVLTFIDETYYEGE